MRVQGTTADRPEQQTSPSAIPAVQPGPPPLIVALLRPKAYTHPADRLELRETHVSWIVLAGQFAYKIKKPIDFGFLDVTTRERRAEACADEVRLNRRLCPDVYLDVVQIVERDGEYFVGGSGRPVEPAVRMRRLPAAGMLPALLARDAVSHGLVRRIARQLAEFHTTATTGTGVDAYGSPAAVRANWEESFAQTTSFVGRTLTPSAFGTIADFVQHFLAEQSERLEHRVREGRIRDGHGDLHAGSICVEQQRVQLFDCLEFSPRFRCADVAAEVAFLAMDLDHHGRADLGATFVDAYVRTSGDTELHRLMSFYRCYRAYVRGKVLGFRLDEPDLGAGSAAAVEAEARAYFDLAWAYAGGLDGPTIVVTMGLPAGGKTTLARELARRLGLVHLSSDVMRTQLAGLRSTDRRIDAYGRGIYGASLTRRTYAALRYRASQWLRRGHSVVVDATFGSPADRAAIQRVAARSGARLHAFVCQADDETICRRLVARIDHGHTTSDPRLDIWPALRAAYNEPSELHDAVTLDTTAPPNTVVDRALRSIQARCPRVA